MNPHRGSTLILALLIVSVVSGMAFAAGQLFVSETRIAGTLEDTSSAYYAAESGIDKGISEFKRDRNAQACKTPPADCTVKSEPTIPTPVSSTNPVSATFTQKMWYLGCVVGDTDNDCDIDSSDLYSPKAFVIAKDGSVLLDISRVACATNGDIDMYFRFVRGNTNISNDPDATIEIKGFSGSSACNPNVPNTYGVRIITNDPSAPQESNFIIPDQFTNTICNVNIPKPCLSVENILRKLTAYSTGITSQNQFTTLQIKFFSRDTTDKLIFGLQPTQNGVRSPSLLIDAGKTTIESIGTFGRVKRKLQAQIDRTSGTVIGIFDFTLFSQTGIQ